MAGVPCRAFAEALLVIRSLSASPSASEISWEVRGVSCTECCSRIDCRETDDASVTLAASVTCDVLYVVDGLAVFVGAAMVPAPVACPVISSLLNASTSSEPLGVAEACGMCATSPISCSISSSVFLKGFGGWANIGGGPVVRTSVLLLIVLNGGAEARNGSSASTLSSLALPVSLSSECP